MTVLLLMGTLLAAQAPRPFEGAPSAIANVIAHGVVPVGLGIVIGLFAPTIASFTRTVFQGGWGMIVSGAALLIAGSLVALLTSATFTGWTCWHTVS